MRRSFVTGMGTRRDDPTGNITRRDLFSAAFASAAHQSHFTAQHKHEERQYLVPMASDE
jgi:hypothetical protein